MPAIRIARAYLTLCLLGLLGSPLKAQPPLPTLRAHAPLVDIQDGDRLLKGAWHVDPRVPLDVYDVVRSAQGKRVTFISDLERLSFEVQPGGTYDFAILLDGKPCRTRLSTRVQPYRRLGSEGAPVSIPITMVQGKPHLQGRVNNSEPLDLILDTGADTNVLYPSALAKGAQLTFDGSVNNQGTGGRTLRQTSSDNRVGVADLRWEHEPVLFVEKQADAADGILGYTVFQDKVVELDFDQMRLLVHDRVPAHAQAFAKTAMPPAGTLLAMPVEVGIGGRREAGPLVLDTGGSGTLTVNAAFARIHGLPGDLKRLGSSVMSGVGNGVIRCEVLLLPELTLAGHTLRNVPLNVEHAVDGVEAAPGGALFMEVLGRFNLILDFPHEEAYLLPNRRFAEPFRVRTSGPPCYMVGLVFSLALVCLGGLAIFLRRGRAPGTLRP